MEGSTEEEVLSGQIKEGGTTWAEHLVQMVESSENHKRKSPDDASIPATMDEGTTPGVNVADLARVEDIDVAQSMMLQIQQQLEMESADSLGGKKKRKLRDEVWGTRLKELIEYKEQNGHCRVKQSSGPLGKWVNSIRLQYKQGSLSADKIAQLNELGFEWKQHRGRQKGESQASTQNASWEKHVKELKEFKEKEGHCNVPQNNRALGMWVNSMRQRFKKGLLPQDRIQELSELGFEWNLRTTWDTHYLELKEFKEKHGHCNVPKQFGRLENWVHCQRHLYMKNKLGEEKVDKLNQLGFEWSRKENMGNTKEVWRKRVTELKEFKDKTGHCNVPGKMPLGRWVKDVRKQFGKASLSADKVEELNVLGFVWEKPEGSKSSRRKSGNSSGEESQVMDTGGGAVDDTMLEDKIVENIIIPSIMGLNPLPPEPINEPQLQPLQQLQQ